MDEKDAMIAAQAEEIRILKEMVVALTAQITELKAKLNKSSKNSSKPPSSDGLRKGAPKNSRTPSGKKSGGQPGHSGTTKALTSEPDTIVELIPTDKCECGGQVVVQTDNYTVRQVTDIEPVKVITVEYRAHDGECAKCGKVHKASFPSNVLSTAAYGENLQALVTYLNVYQLIPLKRASELVEDIFGIKISQGAIVSAGIKAYENLEDAENRVKQEIVGSDVAHFDESGMRVNGKTHWLHSASTKTCTVYSIHKKRGKEAMDDMGILPLFMGTALHDHWKSYYKYLCAHAECNQHHLRTLKYLYEELHIDWAGQMIVLLCLIKRHIDLCKSFGVDYLEQADIDEYERTYRHILSAADQSKEAPTEARCMAKRLAKYEQEALLFMIDFDVPFTNNLAERDIRMPKAKQKISGGFRSDSGAKAFARTRGFISTLKKRGKNVLDGLRSALKGNASEFLYEPAHA